MQARQAERNRAFKKPMASIFNFFSKGDKFFVLLDSAADEATGSVQDLISYIGTPRAQRDLNSISDHRRAEKRIFDKISEELINTFVTQLEREDIEHLADTLHRIPKACEKFAEYVNIAGERADGVDFSRQLGLLKEAVSVVNTMVKNLRNLSDLEACKDLSKRLSQIESKGDEIMLELLGELYSGKHEPLQAFVLRDLYERIEKIIDRCSNVGKVVVQVVLKNS